jgi:hypothetical protein
MKRGTVTVVLLVYLSLLGAQFSGLHMHVDAHGYSGSPHASHSHAGGGADPHDHEHETDVNVLDLGTIASKHLLFALAVAFSILLFLEPCRHVMPRHVRALSSGRKVRLRPPLRAPPLH